MKEDQLSLNDLAVSAVRESAKWCMFLSIVGFISIGIFVILGVFASVAMASIPDDPYGGGMGMNPFGAFRAYIGLVYIVFALLYFFPIYYLYKYAKGTKMALESGNNDLLADALVNLKSHHKFIGIMTIVMLSIYVLIFIVGIIFAASMAGGRM